METGGKQRRRRAQKSDDRIVAATRTVDGIKSSMEQGGRRRLATAVADGRSWRRSDNCHIIGMVSLLPGSSSSSRSRSSGGGGIASMSPESYHHATPSQKSPRRPYRLRNLITGVRGAAWTLFRGNERYAKRWSDDDLSTGRAKIYNARVLYAPCSLLFRLRRNEIRRPRHDA